MLNFSKINNICCWTLVAIILLPKFDIGKSSSNFSHRHLAKREVPCSQQQFRCRSDNKCIDRSEKCDGEKHCADGSDEAAQLCGEITFRSVSSSCTIPQVSLDKHLHGGGHEPGKKVPEFTNVSFKCNPGYRYVLGEIFTSTCRGRNWSPPIENCNKICKPLNPQNVDLKCSRNGYDITCESTLLTGTTVEATCKPSHQAVKSTQSGNYKIITCEEDGEWSNPLYACTPSFSECGKLFPNTPKLGEQGSEEKYGDSPWHVAIYNIFEKDKPLICGGTIISAKLIISAARCFFDGNTKMPDNAEKYEIAVSKVTRNYNKKDNRQTKFHKIQEIKFSPKGYNGYTAYYAVDIAILRVTEDISFSPQVLPACIPSQENPRFRPGVGAIGKLAGWARDENEKESEILLLSANSSHTDGKCSKIAPSAMIKFITFDKLCAKLITTGGAREGDFGAGLLYPNGNSGLYYLQGIVSVKDTSRTSVVLFTDVDKYLDWIIDKKNQVENEGGGPTTTVPDSTSSPRSCNLPQVSSDKHFTVKCPNYINCQQEPGKIVPEFTRVSFKCNPGYQYDHGEIFTSNCSNGNWLPPIQNCKKACKALKPKTVELSCSRGDELFHCKGALRVGTKVHIRCKPHYRHKHPVNYVTIICQENGQWSQPLFSCIPECGKPKSFPKGQPLIRHGTKEDQEESPWHVAIYDISIKNKPSFICGGTIISPQLIISAAHCFVDEVTYKRNDKEIFEIAVGKVTQNYNTKDNEFTKFYKLREILFFKKGFLGHRTHFAGDIVILRVTEDMSLSRAVLPACIRFFHPDEGALGKLVGWGQTENETLSEILLSAKLPYISYEECVKILPIEDQDTIAYDKFCAGSKTGPGAGVGDSGGGLLYPNMGLYYLQGIVSNRIRITNSDETHRTIVFFTDVGQYEYIGWINDTMNKVENEVLSSEIIQ